MNALIRKVIKKKDRVNPAVEVYPSTSGWRTEGEKIAQDKKALILSQARAFVQGSTQQEFAEALGLGSIHAVRKLQQQFLSSEEGQELLKSLLLNNAIGAGSIFLQKLQELNAPQAAGAAQIFTNSFINLDKHSRSTEENIDWKALAELNKEMKNFSSMLELAQLGDNQATPQTQQSAE